MIRRLSLGALLLAALAVPAASAHAAPAAGDLERPGLVTPPPESAFAVPPIEPSATLAGLPTGRRTDRTKDDGTGGLDLRAATLRQEGSELKIGFELDGKLTAKDLGLDPEAGLMLCTELFRGKRHAPRSALCVIGGDDGAKLVRVRLDGKGTAVGEPKTLDQATRNSLKKLEFLTTTAAAGLPLGPFRWRAVLSNTTVPAAAQSRGGGTIAAEEDSPENCDGTCTDKIPDRGTFGGTIRSPEVVGCVATGASYRTNGPRTSKRIAFGFDDGPSVYTGRFLDVLRRYRSHATFFQIGNQMPGQAAIQKRILREGSTVANHSYTHRNLSGGAGDELVRTNRNIVANTGYRTCLFRAPYGAVSSTLIGQARALKMLTIEWDVDPTDWSRPGTGAIVSRVLSQARPGSIVVMHDGGGPRDQSLAALPTIFSTLQQRGYEIVTIEDLLGLKPVYR